MLPQLMLTYECFSVHIRGRSREGGGGGLGGPDPPEKSQKYRVS